MEGLQALRAGPCGDAHRVGAHRHMSGAGLVKEGW